MWVSESYTKWINATPPDIQEKIRHFKEKRRIEKRNQFRSTILIPDHDAEKNYQSIKQRVLESSKVFRYTLINGWQIPEDRIPNYMLFLHGSILNSPFYSSDYDVGVLFLKTNPELVAGTTMRFGHVLETDTRYLPESPLYFKGMFDISVISLDHKANIHAFPELIYPLLTQPHEIIYSEIDFRTINEHIEEGYRLMREKQ